MADVEDNTSVEDNVEEQGVVEEKEPLEDEEESAHVLDEDKIEEKTGEEIETTKEIPEAAPEEEQIAEPESETQADAQPEEEELEEKTADPEEKLEEDVEQDRGETLEDQKDKEQPEIADQKDDEDEANEKEKKEDEISGADDLISEAEQIAPGDVGDIGAGQSQEVDTLTMHFPVLRELKPTSPVPAVRVSQEIKNEERLAKMELINNYEQSLVMREKLQHQNKILQNKLAEHFRKRKTDDLSDSEKNYAHQEQRYLRHMTELENLKKVYLTKSTNYNALIGDLKVRSQERKKIADEERKKFTAFKQNIALKAVNAQHSRPIDTKRLEEYIANEVKKEEEVTIIRLENIKLKNKVKDGENHLKQTEELVEGLHLIDFEQLKIENQTYNEKIEERNEELLRLRKKITSTVQILTHVKEKLQYVQAENMLRSSEMKEVEALLGQNRDILSRTKQARDALRIDNDKLRQKCGFLGNKSLLKDYENQKSEGRQLQKKLSELKMKHDELTINCQHIQKKVKEAGQDFA